MIVIKKIAVILLSFLIACLTEVIVSGKLRTNDGITAAANNEVTSNISILTEENTKESNDINSNEIEKSASKNNSETSSEASNITNIEESKNTENKKKIEQDSVNKSDLVKITDYIPDIIIDLKYASIDNFTGTKIYDSGDAYLRYGTVIKLAKAQEILNKKGYYIVVWDAYRSVDAQFKLWEICPDSRYVANPNNGYSSHSRGNTVDIGLATKDGTLVELPSNFDDFSEKADRDYSDVSENAKLNALMLEEVMQGCGFKGYSAEWWHYSDTMQYEVIR